MPFLALAGLWSSCGEMTTTLPSAIGGIDEVVFVEDPRFAKDTLYTLVDQQLSAQYGNFVHHEPVFDVIHIKLEDLKKTMLSHRNILFVGVLDSESEYNDQIRRLIGQSGVDQIGEGGVFSAERKDLWAAGQHVHILVAADRQSLIDGMEKSLVRMVSRIQDNEFAKIRKNVYISGEALALSDELKREHQIQLRVPAYYQKHPSSNGNFFWLRRSTVDLTASIMIYSHPYRRELESSPAYALFVRDSLGKQYERSQIEGAYMTTEKLIRPLHDTLDLNGHFAIRSQGLWRLEHDFMGGPYVNYLVYDKANNRIIHLDAYIYAPDISRKRKLIRELEAILTTFGVPESRS